MKRERNCIVTINSFWRGPITEIVHQAQDIADVRRESRLEPRSNDKIGVVTQALDVMLGALKQRRVEIEQHAIVSTSRGEKLYVSTCKKEDRYVMLLKHRVHRLSDEDVEMFFSPHRRGDGMECP